MGAGQRYNRIEFKRPEKAENDFGEPETSDFSLITRYHAEINYGRGSERREAGIEGSNLPATFRVLDSAIIRTVNTDDIIEFEDAVWDISSIVPFRKNKRDFTAVRRL